MIVHPPAGIVGGDRLLLTATVNAGAHAQLTTPGAARWYRSAGSQAEQTFRAQVEAGGSLEWLPQGTIVHEGVVESGEIRTGVALRASSFGAANGASASKSCVMVHRYGASVPCCGAMARC